MSEALSANGMDAAFRQSMMTSVAYLPFGTEGVRQLGDQMSLHLVNTVMPSALAYTDARGRGDQAQNGKYFWQK